ncbi:MAG: VCBS repeat-containing protein [Ignavibacteria bacterium]|nr:VCBS repeat-containing protein [Ignavibacteria bacterium]
MMKLLKGENTDFKHEAKRISVVILWVLFLNSAFAQVPINGFCQLNSFPAFPGFSSLAVADVNNDSFQDIILYSSLHKSFVVAEGILDSGFTNYKNSSLPYSFSSINPVYNKENKLIQFAFTSRKNRIAGLFGFSKKGRLKIISKLEFNSFPENISVADINNDGNSEYLISGSGFNGLSVLYYKNGRLAESKIDLNSSYGEAVFVDVSNDGYPDIAAFNLFNNSLDIFYNDGENNFENIRSLTHGINIENLKTVDFDNNNYVDLIYSVKNSFKIIFGDFQSYYDSTVVINVQYVPHRYAVADFNSDKLNDIAYVDTVQGLLSVIFGKDSNQFHPEIIYMKEKGIIDIHVLKSGKNNRLALLNRKGEINIISKLSSLPDEAKLIIGVQPSTIKSFDYGNDRIPDFCFIDKFSNSLHILINYSSGIPSYYYSITLSNDHEWIAVDDTMPFQKGFYCYSVGSKMLEVINLDFTSNKAQSYQLYTPGNIEDLKIKKVDGVIHIYVVYQKDNFLNVGEYEHNNFGFTFKEYPNIDIQVISAQLLITDHPEVYYWKTENESFQFIKADLISEAEKFSLLGSINRKNKPAINSIIQYQMGNEKPLNLTLISGNENFFAVISKGTMFNISNSVDEKNIFDGNKKNKLIYYGSNRKNVQSLLMYLRNEQSFNLLEIKHKSKTIALTKLIDASNVEDFILQKFPLNKNYLIYTQKSEGFISLRRLK